MNQQSNYRLPFCTLALGGLLAVLAGCPGVMNQAPTANAGANQTVTPGSTVTLNGSASSDPDGNPLTFAWAQIGGTNTVTLSSATSATTTFTAPNTDDTLQFQLTVNDGQGGTDSATTTVTVSSTTPPPPPPIATPQLFIANLGGNNVTSYRNPATVNGNIAPDTNLAGAQTQLDQPVDVIVDAGGALLVSNQNSNAITAYADAINTNGNLAPDRNVQGAATLLNTPVSLAENNVQDLVFVANNADDQILVFGNASSAAFNGNVAPIRTIFTATSADLNDPVGVNFGGNDNLYVANRGGNNVLVFANASNLNGDVAPTRIINSAVFNTVIDVFIDGNDNLLVVDETGFIFTFNNAATLNGNVAPDFTLQIQGAVDILALEVDSAGRGYITDAANNAVYSYDNIATRNGLLPPDRTIQGAQTQLNVPSRLYLIE